MYSTPEVPEPAAVADTIREAKPFRISAHSCAESVLVVGATLLVDAFGVPSTDFTAEEDGVADFDDTVADAEVEEEDEADDAEVVELVPSAEITGAFDVVSACATGTSVSVPATAAASESPAMRLTLEFAAIVTSRM